MIAPRYPYLPRYVRNHMDVAAKLTSKGQVTIPRAVREALGVSTGDQLIFRVQGTRAVVARTPEFLDLAGSVPVPESKRGASWDEVVESTRRGRSSERR